MAFNQPRVQGGFFLMSHLFNLDENTSNRLAADMNEQGYAVL